MLPYLAIIPGGFTMIDFEPIYGVGLVLIFLLIRGPILLKNKYRGNIIRLLIESVFVVYLTVLISVAFFPIPYQEASDPLLKGMQETNNFIPFNSIIGTVTTAVDVFVVLKQIMGNLIMLLPFGVLLPMVWRKQSSGVKMLCTGLVTSLLIEILQLLISQIIGFQYRSFDIDDLMLNTLGFFIGYQLYSKFSPAKWKKYFSMSKDAETNVL